MLKLLTCICDLCTCVYLRGCVFCLTTTELIVAPIIYKSIHILYIYIYSQ